MRYLLASIGIFVLFSIPSSVGAIGLSPPEIKIDSVLRNSELVQYANISRAYGVEGDINIRIETSGQDASMISIQDSAVIADDEDQINIPFTISPGEAANGDYEAVITFLVDPDEVDTSIDGTAKVAVVTGVNMVVQFTVSGEQVLSYDITSFEVSETEEGKGVFPTYTVVNKGNIDWRPEKIVLTFQDIDDDTNRFTEEIDGITLPLVKAGAQEDVSFVANSALLQGTYSAVADFYYDGVVAVTRKSQFFNVYPSGTLDQSGEIGIVSTNKERFSSDERILVEVDFKNTGSVPLEAFLVTDVMQGDSIIDLVRGDNVVLAVGESTTLSLLISLDTEGEYDLSSYVSYGSRVTDKQITRVVVENKLPPILGVDGSSSLFKYIVLGLLILLIIIIALLWKRRRAKRQQLPPVDGMPPLQDAVTPVQSQPASAQELQDDSGLETRSTVVQQPGKKE